MAAKFFVFYLFALLAGLTAVQTAPLVHHQRDEASGNLAVARQAEARGIFSDISNITSIVDSASLLKKIAGAGAALVSGAVEERDEHEDILARGLGSTLGNSSIVNILKGIVEGGAVVAAASIGERQVDTAAASGSLALPSFHTIVSVVDGLTSALGTAKSIGKSFNVSASSIF